MSCAEGNVRRSGLQILKKSELKKKSNNNNDNTQQNNKHTFCDDKDKTINHIISECSKLA